LIRIPEIVPVCSKINEGGYTKTKKVFNQAANKVLVKDYKNKNEKTLCSKKNTQDIYLRSIIEIILELTN
jgi:hypothetical protein